MIALIMPSAKSDKKYDVSVVDGKTMKTISFGAKGYEDYTIHHDAKRKQSYMQRHRNEDWGNPFTAGFWAKHLLWNKKTVKESADDIITNYGIGIILAL